MTLHIPRILVLTTLVCTLARAAPPTAPRLEDLLVAMGQGPDVMDRLRAGEIVSTELKASRDTELGVTLLMLVKKPPADVISFVASEKFFDVDQDTLDAGDIDPAAPEKGLARVKLQASDAKEIQRWLNAEPGKELNLSAAELASFAALRERLGGKKASEDAKAADQVSQAIRLMLAERVKACRAKGLAGIDTYARSGGGTSSPAEQIAAAQDASTVLAKHAPRLAAALAEFPGLKDNDVKQRWLWLKISAQDRPAFVLSHRMRVEEPGVFVSAERQFYVGHSYSSSLALAGLFEVPEGTVIAYASRLHTDEVAGSMGGMKRNIGRGMMGKSLRKLFENLRTTLEKR